MRGSPFGSGKNVFSSLEKGIVGTGVTKHNALCEAREYLRQIASASLSAPGATERADIVPGLMRCGKCDFRLMRQTIYMESGIIGAGTSETEPCSNGCGPLWPITWEEQAYDLAAQLDALYAEKRTLAVNPADELVAQTTGETGDKRVCVIEVGDNAPKSETAPQSDIAAAGYAADILKVAAQAMGTFDVVKVGKNYTLRLKEGFEVNGDDALPDGVTVRD
jgi:hypothetical protein